ncbi:SDR family oxidoreductase [Ponticoccus litoralis]|uniref:SDR family NAD(P)-dependent oxidoreductase n=1 Tax=Ponticoccus litoralis TaxID=422297 RepID=A0AAW9SLH8_9RHOB
MPFLSENRVVITAGASGIGRAMAEGLAREGAKVWVTDVDEAALESCPAAWRKSRVDASDATAMEALFAEILDVWGGLDTLCANAGISGPTAAIQDVSLDDWQKCLAVNLDGAFLAAKHAAPMMIRQNSGSIIVTSSTAGIGALPRRAPYVTAKWGMIGLAKTLSMELGPHGIRANAICPGSVDGPRMDGVIQREAAATGQSEQAVRDSYTGCSAMRSFVAPEDIANIAVFLASDRSRFVSGQVISVDGFTIKLDA